MTRIRMLSLAAVLALWPLAVHGEFEPLVATRFEVLTAGDPTLLAQDLVLLEGDEVVDNIVVDLDQGFFDLDDLEVDAVIGVMIVLTDGGEIILPNGVVIELESEFVADVVVTGIDEAESTLTADAIVVTADDPDVEDLVVFELTLMSFAGGGAQVKLTNQVPIFFEDDIELTWAIDLIYVHGQGDVLTVSTTLASLEETELDFEEEFEIEDADGRSIGEFKRGDVNGDGSVSAIADGLYLLRWGLDGDEAPPCLDAADVDDSGTVSALPDALALLRWQFGDAAAPPDPGPEECGPDPDPNDDIADCEFPPEACS